MIAASLDSAQQHAVDLGLDAGVAIVGANATGKTTALVARLERARAQGYASPLVAESGRRSPERVHQLAIEVLRDAGERVRLIDDVEAELLFERAAAPLLAMESELVELEIDPEVPGLRSPLRFLASAFRLQRRLSEELFSADAFLERALAGATEFYAKPPNFALPDLIAATKNEHRSSLAIAPAELERQYRREVDLAKLLAQMFRAYARALNEQAVATGRDAVARAIALLSENAPGAQKVRERYGLAFLDDAQQLTRGETTLLQRVFGVELPGVTLAGDLAVVPAGMARVELTQSFRLRPPLTVTRPATQREEARAIAAHVASLLENGVPQSEIAILLRSVATPAVYEEALLDRNVCVQIGGDYNVFADRRAHDALALLWNLHDPFRHDWLLRTLEGSAMALSDASIAVLCGEPADKQIVLFEEEPLASPSVSARRDSDRDVRLGRNVLGGDCDASLSPLARERVERFRAMREGWLRAQERLAFDELVLLVWKEGLAREGVPGSARARAQQRVLEELLARFATFRDAHPDATLGDVLEDAERRAESSLEACEAPAGEGVRLLSVPCARGRAFDHVVVANVRPGAFPRWYAPDAFLFSPSLGMIPKDNAGDAPTARTAKFTYYLYRVKAASRYYTRERKLWNDALGRARKSLLVTASGRATRAFSAPEFLEELR